MTAIVTSHPFGVLDANRIANLPQVLTYNGPGGVLDSIKVGPDSEGNYFKQTRTFTGANVTGISAWVKQ